MESYVLSCCSTVDISKEWAEKRNILLAYFRFYLNEEEYRDDFYASLSQEKLFERMLNGEKSKTSQVKFMTLINPHTAGELSLQLELTEQPEVIVVKNVTSFGDTIALKLTNTYKLC